MGVKEIGQPEKWKTVESREQEEIYTISIDKLWPGIKPEVETP